ncbi:MAG: hypothetical protein AAF840_03790 [Bacteroidota bacterium]
MTKQIVTIEVFKDMRTGAWQVVPQPGSTVWGAPSVDANAEPTRFTVPREEHSGWNWAPWGTKDDIPTLVRTKVEDVPMAGQAMYRLMAMMYGNGLVYYRNSDLLNDPTTVQRANIPIIENFLNRNHIKLRYLLPQFLAYRYTANAFSEVIFSRDGRLITGLYHLDSEFCRKSRQNERSLRSEYLYYSADFASRWRSNIRNGAAIPLLDWRSTDQQVEEMISRGRRKAAWHSHLPTPGTLYYATPPWIGLFRDKGWMDNAAAIPEIVYAMAHNQIMLKYQILIPMSYFRARYGDAWDNYTHEQRQDIQDKFSQFIEDELADTENAYKSITTFFDTDFNGQERGKVEIVAIDDKIKRDSWVPSANAADAQIVQTLGVHPSQFGLAPEGGKMGAGSGSDQREGFNTMIQVNTLEQEIALELLNWTARYNARTLPEWDVTFAIDHSMHTTTNEKESGVVPGDTTLIVE